MITFSYLRHTFLLQVVVTPLYQAPSVINAGLASSTGAAVWQHLTSSFGYLNKEASPHHSLTHDLDTNPVYPGH